jgi:SAM-dependent methyltransferase
MLTLTHASLATMEELFRYKEAGFVLPDFPGYTSDQWGIKAHNRPWIEEKGQFEHGQRVLEVGGAYSRLPEYLGTKFGVEPWIADDFGVAAGEEAIWSRWGDPTELPGRYPGVHYVFRRLGEFTPELPNAHFDRVFSVSTLEHIPLVARPPVLLDMHRILAPGGFELHTIDVATRAPHVLATQWLASRVPPLQWLDNRLRHDVTLWIDLFRKSGVRIGRPVPSILTLLSRSILVESPDVVYRYYPPNDSPKPYRPAASLLIVIQKT